MQIDLFIQSGMDLSKMHVQVNCMLKCEWHLACYKVKREGGGNYMPCYSLTSRLRHINED